jgi:glycosyltransferase involved in cell wall biosynthesis
VHSADITYVVLTKNEAANIAACLRSLPAQSAVLVYDAFSNDATVELARSFGALVIQAPWDGYVRAREDAAAQVKTLWTFMLDADERVTAELALEIEQLAPANSTAGYSVARRNYFCGRWIRSGGWWPDRLVRLFRTGQATIRARGSGDVSVHEAWQVSGDCEQLRAPLDHFSYTSIEQYRRKFAIYTGLEARGTHAGLGHVIAAWLLMPLRAAWYLVRRGGIIEGWRGAYVSIGSASYPAVVATKSWTRGRTSAPRATI